ncbi:inositol monophosphatase family protein, partial [Candidatus Poriferisocius sp.]|uniref:inositol monophosphatase family protein n=1 Tax=Candidatus Poriferisocius sp. TaxID=3101276 RepID=UPI003B51C9FC
MVIREAFGRPVLPEMKGLVDPVTAADLEAEAAIIEVLSRNRPGDAVLGEEGGGQTESRGRRWIIDPLDGTVNFVHQIPHVAVSIGLWDGDQPLVGVVVDVMRGEIFQAVRGEGAFLNGQRIKVSSGARLKECLVATGFPYDRHINGPAYSQVAG